MTSDGKFMLHNQGKRPIFINGAPVVSGSMMQLLHNSALEVNVRMTYINIKKDAVHFVCCWVRGFNSNLTPHFIFNLQICGLKFLFLINPELKKLSEEQHDNL